jgi:hypothetical protein
LRNLLAFCGGFAPRAPDRHPVGEFYYNSTFTRKIKAALPVSCRFCLLLCGLCSPDLQEQKVFVCMILCCNLYGRREIICREGKMENENTDKLRKMLRISKPAAAVLPTVFCAMYFIDSARVNKVGGKALETCENYQKEFDLSKEGGIKMGKQLMNEYYSGYGNITQALAESINETISEVETGNGGYAQKEKQVVGELIRDLYN